ncbi:NADH dehydrogenase [ubiquinone] 1 beta subcomplex subunit 5, mitochondrial-like [Antedon mediterranea]|uniref:NADH dehydrogenase [ubiquinone] 1 beta subcomplex subunit 5, mitochondrial-like n=1 Tax=Antedon mediterranea TaxID=105859 RepID=UPI003AF707B9
MANCVGTNLFRCINRILSVPTVSRVQIKGMSGGATRKFFPHASTYTDRRFLRRAMFYASLTGVPSLAVITYVNVLYGEAELSKIPEGYVPKHWEYYPHPISRFIARYLKASPQQEYEKQAHVMELEHAKSVARKQEREIKRQMRKRGDGDYKFIPIKNSLQVLSNND